MSDLSPQASPPPQPGQQDEITVGKTAVATDDGKAELQQQGFATVQCRE